jgi:hypothetical protein
VFPQQNQIGTKGTAQGNVYRNHLLRITKKLKRGLSLPCPQQRRRHRLEDIPEQNSRQNNHTNAVSDKQLIALGAQEALEY